MTLVPELHVNNAWRGSLWLCLTNPCSAPGPPLRGHFLLSVPRPPRVTDQPSDQVLRPRRIYLGKLHLTPSASRLTPPENTRAASARRSSFVRGAEKSRLPKENDKCREIHLPPPPFFRPAVPDQECPRSPRRRRQCRRHLGLSP